MIDEIDATILDLLQDNARISQADVARVGRAGALRGARADPQARSPRGHQGLCGPGRSACARPVDAGLRGGTEARRRPGDDSVAQALAQCPEVLELHHVAGDDCYLLKVRARDAEHIGQLLRHRFGRIPGVRSTRTTIVLETVKETPRLPVARRAGASSDDAVASSARERRLAWYRLDRGLPDLGHDVSRHPHQLETMPPMLMAGLRWTLAGGAARRLHRRRAASACRAPSRLGRDRCCSAS